MSELLPGAAAFPGSGYDPRIERLRHITGFVTAYGAEVDPRVSVFARLWHVERVALVARMMGEVTDAGEVARVERLVWFHDLNRWPFAHNSERGRFDQAANVAEYFAEDPDTSRQDLLDLRGIHEKDPDALSHEGRIVLFADALTGVFEDILFAVTGLNVHPRLIPGEVENLLGCTLREGRWFTQCEHMARALHGPDGPRVPEFQEELAYVFGALVRSFLGRHDIGELRSGCRGLFDITGHVKKNFIRPVIFPLNNEKVCHSSWIRDEVMPWYLAHVEDARARLLEIDERAFVADVLARDAPFAAGDFLPDVEYVARETPALAFVR